MNKSKLIVMTAALCALAACGPTRKISKNPPLLPAGSSDGLATGNAGGNSVNPAPGGAAANPAGPTTDAPRAGQPDAEASALAKAVDSISPTILDSEDNLIVVITLKTPEQKELSFVGKRDAITGEGTQLEAGPQNEAGYTATLKCATAKCADGGVLTLAKADGPLAGSAEITIKRTIGVVREVTHHGELTGVQKSLDETFAQVEGVRSRVAILSLSQVKGAASLFEVRVLTDLTPEGADSNDPDKGVVKEVVLNGKLGKGAVSVQSTEVELLADVTAEYSEADHSLKLTSTAENGLTLVSFGDKQ